MAFLNITAHKACPAKSVTQTMIWRYLFVGCCFMLSACQTTNNQTITANGVDISDAPLSESLSSNYLMARQAVYQNDLPSATDFFTNSLVKDDNNIALLRHSFLTHYQSGNIEQAAEIARRMESLNVTMPLAQEPALIESALAEDWGGVSALADILSQSDTSLVIANVAHAWALFAQGQFAGAISQMSQTANLLQNELGLTPAFMELQIAHLLEVAGKTQEALAKLNSLGLIENYPPHIQLSIASAYHRLGDKRTAIEILEEYLSPSFDNGAIIASFKDESNRLLQPMTVRRGLAQSLLDTSWLDTEKSIRSLLLARAQLALIIQPDFEAAHFVIAQEYLALNQLSAAKIYLDDIEEDSSYYLPSQFMLTAYLRRTGEINQALDLVRALRSSRPYHDRLTLVEADIWRSVDRCSEAAPLYNALLESRFDNSRLHRNLAICLERTAETKEDEALAEQYFLSSLARDPNDAFTLNYLGYWYADTNRKLDDAITYIKRAVELRPSSGFFADSLGWVYYRLENYDEAILWLEKAIQLEPLDPVITEHLGDVYWVVGRDFEAIYKWQLARKQASEDDMITRLDGKLSEAESQDGRPLETYPY